VKCKNIIGELSSFLDGELDAGTIEHIRQHLERCEDCRLLVDTTRKTIQIYCNSEPVPLPKELQDRLHHALIERLRRTKV
jgi:anti-sigma factor (TIGR02949 family)